MGQQSGTFVFDSIERVQWSKMVFLMEFCAAVQLANKSFCELLAAALIEDLVLVVSWKAVRPSRCVFDVVVEA